MYNGSDSVYGNEGLTTTINNILFEANRSKILEIMNKLVVVDAICVKKYIIIFI